MSVEIKMTWVAKVKERLDRMDDAKAEVVARKAEERATKEGRDTVIYEDLAFANVNTMRNAAGFYN